MYKPKIIWGGGGERGGGIGKGENSLSRLRFKLLDSAHNRVFENTLFPSHKLLFMFMAPNWMFPLEFGDSDMLSFHLLISKWPF